MNKQEIIEWLFDKLEDFRKEHSEKPWNDYLLGKQDALEEILEELIELKK